MTSADDNAASASDPELSPPWAADVELPERVIVVPGGGGGGGAGALHPDVREADEDLLAADGWPAGPRPGRSDGGAATGSSAAEAAGVAEGPATGLGARLAAHRTSAPAPDVGPTVAGDAAQGDEAPPVGAEGARRISGEASSDAHGVRGDVGGADGDEASSAHHERGGAPGTGGGEALSARHEHGGAPGTDGDEAFGVHGGHGTAPGIDRAGSGAPGDATPGADGGDVLGEGDASGPDDSEASGVLGEKQRPSGAEPAADDEWEGPPTEAMAVLPPEEADPEPTLAAPPAAVAAVAAGRDETGPGALRPSAPEPVPVKRSPSASRRVVSRVRAFIGLVLVVVLSGAGLAAAIGVAVLLVAVGLKRAFGS